MPVRLLSFAKTNLVSVAVKSMLRLGTAKMSEPSDATLFE